MKREEAKKAAAKSYASKMCDLCLDESCKERGPVCHQFKEYTTAFTEGIKWADEHPVNVWHDASEEPAGDDWVILCEDDSGYCFTANKIIVVELYLNWQRHAEKMWLKRWAYVSDLLPKGGEEL